MISQPAVIITRDHCFCLRHCYYDVMGQSNKCVPAALAIASEVYPCGCPVLTSCCNHVCVVWGAVHSLDVWVRGHEGCLWQHAGKLQPPFDKM